MTADHDAIRAADGVILPGVGAFPEAMRNLAARRPRRGRARARGGRRAAAGDLPRHAAAVRASTEHEGAAASASCAGDVTALRAPKLPHIGWNLVSVRAQVGPDSPASARRRRSTTCTPSPAGPPSRRTWSAAASTASGSPRSSSAATSSACSSTPRSPRRDGLALLANFARACAPGARLDPLSRHRHPRRAGRSGSSRGASRTSTVYHDDPLDAARSWVRRGARASCTWSTSTARGPGSRSRSTTCAGSWPAPACPSQYGGGLRSLDGASARRCGPGRSARWWAPRRSATSDFLDDILAASARGSSSRSTCAAG